MEQYFKAIVAITLRNSIVDPQGAVIVKSLHSLKFDVSSIRMGKYLEIRLLAPDMEAAKTTVEEMCDKLLVNSVTEQYRLLSLEREE